MSCKMTFKRSNLDWNFAQRLSAAFLLLLLLLLPATSQSASTVAPNLCREPGSTCRMTICPGLGNSQMLVPCPDTTADISIDEIEFLPPDTTNRLECNRAVSDASERCLTIHASNLTQANLDPKFVSCIGSILDMMKDEFKRQVTGRCIFNSLSELTAACYRDAEKLNLRTGPTGSCLGLMSRHNYRLSVLLSRKDAPTTPTSTVSTAATTTSLPTTEAATTTTPIASTTALHTSASPRRPELVSMESGGAVSPSASTESFSSTLPGPGPDPLRTEKPSCLPGYVLAESVNGSRCESLSVSGDACRSLASRTTNAYQREDGGCALVPDNEDGVRKALAETKNSSVKAQVLCRFAQTQQFDNATEASNFASLLELEAASAFDNSTAEELRQNVGDLLAGVTAFASKDCWLTTASIDKGEGEDGEKNGRKLAQAAGAVMRALDSLGRGLQFAGSEVNVSSPAIAMSVRRLHSGLALMRSDSAAVKIDLADGAAASTPVSMVTSVVNLPHLIRRLGNADRPVASRIVQATLYSADSGERLNSTVRVLLLLPHLDGSDVGTQQRRCVFVDSSDALSERGCRPVAELSDSSRTACSCEHLTSFAAVVVPGTVWLGPETHRLLSLHSPLLKVLTYICLGVSIACLLVTNVTYLAIKLRGPLADKSVVTLHRVHHSLCFALLLAHSFYLIGFNPPAQLGHLGCQILSGLTLYALLCVFCWLLCEGLMYAKSLIVVLPGVDSAFSKIKFQHYCLLSYLAPALIVAVTAGLRHPQLIQLESPSLELTEPSASQLPAPKACWLSEELGTNYAFLAPMLLVCVANLLVFIVVMIKLTQRDAVRGPKPELLPYLRRQVKLSVTLAGLLGLTWLLGLLFYFAHTHLFVALHYAFTVLNGLQGCFIFFTQIFAHDRIRDGWEKRLLQSRCTPHCLRAWLQSRRHARMSGTGGSSQSKNAGNAAKKARVTPGGNKQSSSGGGSGGSIPSLINLLRRLSLRRRNNNSNNTTGVSELSPMCKNSAAGGSGSGGGCGSGSGGGGGGGRHHLDDESQPFLSSTRDDSSTMGGGHGSHKPAPLVTEDNFTSTCPPPESGFFESQLAADDQSLFDITHSMAEPALAPPPPPAIATLPDRPVDEDC